MSTVGDLTWIKGKNLRVRPGSKVHLRHPGAGVIVGSGIVESDKGDPSILLQRLHNYTLQEHQAHAREGEKPVGVRWLTVDQKHLGLPYPYSFCGIEVPDQISETLVNGIYAWDLNSLQLVATEEEKEEEGDEEEDGEKEEKEEGGAGVYADADDGDAGDPIEGVPDEVSLED